MLIPRSLCRYFSDNLYGLTGADIYCNEAIRNDVSEALINNWKKTWTKAIDACYRKPTKDDYNLPKYDIVQTDHGIRFLTYSVNVFGRGDYIEPYGYGERSFREALEKLKEKFPSAEYYAHVITYGAVSEHPYPVAMEFCSIKDKNFPHGFIGEYLEKINCDDFCKSFEKIIHYKFSEDSYGNYYKNDESCKDSDDGLTVYTDSVESIFDFFIIYDKYIPQEIFDMMLEYAVREKETETVAAMSLKITKDNIDRLIEISQEHRKTSLTLWLLNFKNKNIGFSDELQAL